MKKSKKITSLFLIAVLTLSMAFTACSKKETPTDENSGTENGEGNNGDANSDEFQLFDGSQNASKLVLTVGDSKVYLDEMMYYILYIERNYDYYDQMYQMMGSGSIWETEQEGMTGREAAKAEVLQAAEMYEILYNEAVKAGLTVSEEDKATFDTDTDEFMKSLTEDQIKVTAMTKELMLKLYEKLTLSDKYYEKLLEEFNVKKEDFQAEVTMDKYKQYNTEAIFIPTTETDAEGNAKDLSEDDKKAALEKIEKVLKKAQKGDAFAEIVEGNEDLQNMTYNFIAEDETASEDYKKAAMKMKNDEVSDVIEAAEGYYIIKMNDNNSSERYDSELENAVNTKNNELFSAKYEELKAAYTITVNDEVWNTIVMGKMTLIPTDEPAPEEGTEGIVPEGNTDEGTEGESTEGEGSEGTEDNADSNAEGAEDEKPAE